MRRTILHTVGTRESRRQRGRRRGQEIVRRLVSELRVARQVAGLSQRAVAADLGWSQSELSRLEGLGFMDVPIPRLAELGAVLGLDFGAGLYRQGEPLRDSGSEALLGRLAAIVAPPYRMTREVLLPAPGDLRSWDALLRREPQLVGVEAETRIRDLQALVRHIRERERDGGVDEIIVVLSNTAHNRALVEQLRKALGPRFETSPRLMLAALRAGRLVPGSGVVLL